MTPASVSAARPGPGRLRAGWPRIGRLRTGLALDLGSERTRAWLPGRGVILDVPTVTFPGAGGTCPVQRGAVVDPAGAARLLDRLLGRSLPRSLRPLIVLTTPVLGGPDHRRAALSALEVLRPRTVLTVPGARAVALAAHGETSRPVLVVDIGAHLTEVALLTDGAVTDAYRVALGTTDLEATATPGDIGRSVAAMVDRTLQLDSTGQALEALRHGPLLAGGGALLPECVRAVAGRLDVPVRPVAAPRTAALRGAARLLRSAVGGQPAPAP